MNFSHIPVDYYNILLVAQVYHAAAVLCSNHDKHEQAIDIWKKYIISIF